MYKTLHMDEKIDRTKSGGASEVAALFGCHPFISYYSLLCDKTGLSEPRADTERLNAGRFLEPSILQELNRITGSEFAHNTRMTSFTPRITATPDGIWHRMPIAVCDIKTVLPFMSDHWKDGTPEYIKWQLRQQMLCVNAESAMTGAMFGFSSPRHEWFERNKEDDDKIIAAWNEFWEIVDGKRPWPEPDGHRATTAVLAQQKPQASVIELGSEVQEWSDELAMLEAKAKAIEPRQQELKNMIRVALKGNSVGMFSNGNGWRVSIIKRKESVTKASTYTAMRRIKGKEAIEGLEDFE